jgi:hypothetical protein
MLRSLPRPATDASPCQAPAHQHHDHLPRAWSCAARIVIIRVKQRGPAPSRSSDRQAGPLFARHPAAGYPGSQEVGRPHPESRRTGRPPHCRWSTTSCDRWQPRVSPTKGQSARAPALVHEAFLRLRHTESSGHRDRRKRLSVAAGRAVQCGGTRSRLIAAVSAPGENRPRRPIRDIGG